MVTRLLLADRGGVMAKAEGPLLPRRRLGAELRRLRDTRTLEQVAEDTLISTSKLSRLENGQGVPQPRDIRDLIAYYQVDPPTAERLRRWMSTGRRQAWWKEYSEVISQPLDAYLDFESGASTIRTYAQAVIPGLLQTPEYAAHILAAIPPKKDPGHISQLIEIRARRQENLLGSDSPTRLITVIDEAALRRIIGSEEETWQQLDRLRQLADTRRVTIQVLPFEAGAHAGLMGMFTIFQFADEIDRDIVSVETHSGDRYLEEESSVLEYLRLFDSVSHSALDAQDSQAFLTKIMSDFAPPKEKR
ncbi:MAG TPA: helix-turn-helix transcriptional regulator [Pseudonocardia sp.]|jgi:transcriptional regulator with XRE-family HTH domain|nr:helix-turn-helix transcriptional regulator [Pseudonocardia sp.]